MKKTTRTLSVTFALLTVSLLASRATAGSISFTNFIHSGSSGVNWDVTIDDNTAGLFTVVVKNPADAVGPPPNGNGDIAGIGFWLTGISAANTITSVTPAGSPFVASSIVPAGASSFGNANFNGGTPDIPDFNGFLDYGSGSSPGNFLQTVTFTVARNGLDLDDWKYFGVRAQTVTNSAGGTGGDDSSKDWSERTPEIPVPSNVVSLLAALSTLGAVAGVMRFRRA